MNRRPSRASPALQIQEATMTVLAHVFGTIFGLLAVWELVVACQVQKAWYSKGEFIIDMGIALAFGAIATFMWSL